MNSINNDVIGIVTVTVDGARYRGAYRVQDDVFVVTAYGLVAARASAALVAGGGEKVRLNLAKLMLTDMVSAARERRDADLTLSLQGSTSTIIY